MLERHPGRWNVVGLSALGGAVPAPRWNDLPYDRREELRELAERIRAGEPGIVDPGLIVPRD